MRPIADEETFFVGLSESVFDADSTSFRWSYDDYYRLLLLNRFAKSAGVSVFYSSVSSIGYAEGCLFFEGSYAFGKVGRVVVVAIVVAVVVARVEEVFVAPPAALLF